MSPSGSDAGGDGGDGQLDYEKERRERIARNRAVLAGLGVRSCVACQSCGRQSL